VPLTGGGGGGGGFVVDALAAGHVWATVRSNFCPPPPPPPSQAPVFWNWVGPSTVGIVTATGVYHWSSSADGSAPVQMFERGANVAGTQIINYAASPDYKWLLLAGIKPASVPGGVAAEGALQLYSVEKKVSQSLSAHAGCFHVTTRLAGRTDPALLFLFVEHKPGPGERPKLQIIEIGRERTAPGGVFRPAPVDLPVPADGADDFAVTMQVSLGARRSGYRWFVLLSPTATLPNPPPLPSTRTTRSRPRSLTWCTS